MVDWHQSRGRLLRDIGAESKKSTISFFNQFNNAKNPSQRKRACTYHCKVQCYITSTLYVVIDNVPNVAANHFQLAQILDFRHRIRKKTHFVDMQTKILPEHMEARFTALVFCSSLPSASGMGSHLNGANCFLASSLWKNTQQLSEPALWLTKSQTNQS